MSTFSMAERHNLEKFLGMSSGYVLNFSDRTFGEFVFETVGIDIHDEKYTEEGTSKAKKLRTFWKLEGVHEAARGADVIKRLLSNLSTIGNGLAELRGLYGTGHGKHGSATGLGTRHAKLAVGAAATLTVFLFETHMETKR